MTPRIAQHGLGRVEAEPRSGIEDQDAVGECGKCAHLVFDHDQRQAQRGMKVAEQADEEFDLLGVEAAQRLIEEQEPRARWQVPPQA